MNYVWAAAGKEMEEVWLRVRWGRYRNANWLIWVFLPLYLFCLLWGTESLSSFILPKLKEGPSASRLESLNKTVIVVLPERSLRTAHLKGYDELGSGLSHTITIRCYRKINNGSKYKWSAVFKTDRNDYSINSLGPKGSHFAFSLLNTNCFIN